METATERFAAVCLLVVGLSHLLWGRAWAECFVRLRGQGHAGVFANGLLSLTFGAFVVAFHPVWHGLPAVLTVLGWAQVLKGGVSLVFPQAALLNLSRVSPARAWHFRLAGIIALAISALLWYALLTR